MRGAVLAVLALLLIAGGFLVAIHRDGDVGVLVGAGLFVAGMVLMRLSFRRGAR